MEFFGGKFDFLLHSIGMSPNVRKGIPYDNINYDFYLKTLDISAFPFTKSSRYAARWMPLMTGVPLWPFPMWLLSERCLDTMIWPMPKHCWNQLPVVLDIFMAGRKRIRINTISQSPTLTTAGSGVFGIDSLIDFTERMSPLGNATADDCADYCVTLFSDLTRKVTMQNLFHDGGFSSMGMSEKAMTQYDKSFRECPVEPGFTITCNVRYNPPYGYRF